MQLMARALARGQGKTKGYHERVIPCRPRTVAAMSDAQTAQELGDIARSRIQEIRQVQSILASALRLYLNRGTRSTQPQPRSSDQDTQQARPPRTRAKTDPWLNRLDQTVDRSFFDSLQDEFEAPPDERQALRDQWLQNGRDGVIDQARQVLRQAQDSMQEPGTTRHRAQARSTSLFEGSLRSPQGLPRLFHRPDEPETATAPEESREPGDPQPDPAPADAGTQTP